MSNRDLINELLHLDSFNSAVTEKAAAVLESHEWQDISTAPKDGTKILVWVPETWVCVSWRTDRNMNGWTAWEDDDYQFHPTHWQPLPQPPGDKDESLEV